MADKKCIRCEDIVNELPSGGMCKLCINETTVDTGFICSECKETGKKHIAKGMCSNCYQKARKKPEQNKPEQRVEKEYITIKAQVATLVFMEEDRVMYDLLLVEAKKNRRTLENEILFRLQNIVTDYT